VDKPVKATVMRNRFKLLWLMPTLLTGMFALSCSTQLAKQPLVSKLRQLTNRPIIDHFEDLWLKDPPAGEDLSKVTRVKTDAIVRISDSKVKSACDLLKDNDLVELDGATLASLSGSKPPVPNKKTRYYLVRCVTAGDSQECMPVYHNDTLWINSMVLSHGRIRNLIHTPLIVGLERKPARVYVSFAAAE
jgi:hypothetical protein